MLTPAQRNFGVLGDLLTVFLFVYVAGMPADPVSSGRLPDRSPDRRAGSAFFRECPPIAL